eukprot:GEZU01003703.1.p1 GENE.GEZU01003703.1~~GEZU01003703.1.p1  ORF type:complete len:198 (-),score=38.77 GEZU01003703.1:149-742(-)
MFTQMRHDSFARKWIKILIPSLLLNSAIMYFAVTYSAFVVLFYYLLPARLAVGLLALFFDVLPHYPQLDPSKARCTALVYANNRFLQFLLHLALLGQDLHVVHHAYPTIPFYRYRDMWILRRDRFVVASSSMPQSAANEEKKKPVPTHGSSSVGGYGEEEQEEGDDGSALAIPHTEFIEACRCILRHYRLHCTILSC